MLKHISPNINAYETYGDPYKLAEFRLLVLNECSRGCRGCFYKRSSNQFDDFDGALNLATELEMHGYQLETCYLLPTDIFDNPENYKLLDNPTFVKILEKFSYVGIASTIEDGYDKLFFDLLFSKLPDVSVELQVNLVLNKIFDPDYVTTITNTIEELRTTYSDLIVINLAINTGFTISPEELEQLNVLMNQLSEDGILELNFTFLYNDDIPEHKRQEMVKHSIATANTMRELYQTNPLCTQVFTERTLLRKPSFVFDGKPNNIYVNPMIPFDEYVFIRDEEFRLKNPTYDSFIECWNGVGSINTQADDICTTCEHFAMCYGKGYFSVARKFNIGCFQQVQMPQNTRRIKLWQQPDQK